MQKEMKREYPIPFHNDVFQVYADWRGCRL